MTLDWDNVLSHYELLSQFYGVDINLDARFLGLSCTTSLSQSPH
jgi:hypothetical protein